MHSHSKILVITFYICTFAVRNDIIMKIHTENNPAYPAGSSERDGTSTLIMLFRSLRVGFFNLLTNAKQQEHPAT